MSAMKLTSLLLFILEGVPGVKADRYEEGMAVKHCALSLVGEPIMYPEINRFLRLLHHHKISSFLVTNAQFPEEIRHHTNPVGTEWRWKMDQPEKILQEAIENHQNMIKQFRGNQTLYDHLVLLRYFTNPLR
ncbi:S-adenosyl-L-methionine-dependent tRNA 4-demethylwyosine synthase [Acipenser ruthenus]|uniref:S-adenosyl-L-methionine-dependent tRNA 4-demethylwyosine synthase n=1 Tax=Acipenser ruthenus TaxID=7906 RepID=A0A444UQW7_ACIRT|nr:S-adenosyl-L-methionine-dependent tRNA 4-demethylwyosine synthase [Acipenser ruthenus]